MCQVSHVTCNIFYCFDQIGPLHYVFRSIVALHSLRLKLCSVKCIVHWADSVQQQRCPSMCCHFLSPRACFFSVDRVRIFTWTKSAFWCGSVVSSRALKTGMCSGCCFFTKWWSELLEGGGPTPPSYLQRQIQVHKGRLAVNGFNGC